MSGEYSRPKTVLGFFAAIVALLVPAGVTLIWLVVTRDKGAANGYIIAALGFIAALVAVIVIGVIVVMWRDPSRLMLGTISGREYWRIQQLTQGDNVTGERTEDIGPRRLKPGQTPAIEAAQTPDDDGDEQ